MSFFSGLDTERYDRQYSDRQLARRMAGYFTHFHRQLWIIAILLILISIAGALQPIIVSAGIDVLNTNLTLANILSLGFAIMGLGVFIWWANWGRRRLTVRIVGDVVLRLRNDTLTAAAAHDLSFYDEFSSGRIVSRITSDTQEFGQVVLLITDLFSQFAQAAILAFVLFRIDWRLALYLTAFLPVIFIVALSFRRWARIVTRRGMRAMANVNATIKETVSGIAIAKNFRQEISIYDQFNQANQLSYTVNVQRGFVLALVFPTLNALGGIGIALLVYFGGLSVVQGLVTAGAWYLFLQSLDRFFFPVLNLSAFWTQVQSGLSAAERVFSLIDAESLVRQVDKVPPRYNGGEIVFDRVWFRYSPEEPVLEEFSLRIRPGENLALVGHTGAGKSSIAKLIARFYEFQQGSIMIDGQDIRSLDLHAYRSRLGIVSQVPFLFSGTVVENICYACPTEAVISEIENLAKKIGNGEWLETLPQGLFTEVGERGNRLSMGQRQLVSLMRVLVQKPAIFILDEATASVDPFTEWQIHQALSLILANTTSIMIAHRLSTVKAADRIIVLEKGKIIEEGSHSHLLAKQGNYANLYNTYFRHQSPDFRFSGLDEFLKEKQSLKLRLDNDIV